METVGKRVLVAITEDHRQVMRDARERLGLSRTTLEQQAKLGKEYVKKVEVGRTKRSEPARLRRLLQTLQKAAERGQVPAKVTAGLARALKSIEKQGPRTAKQ